MAISAKLPSIPDYYKQYVDSSVDLTVTPYIPCPFHKEVHGKSFAFSKQLGLWRCFGACHFGGDVIALHQMNKKFKTRDEAKRSLYTIYGVTYTEEFEEFAKRERPKPDPKEVHRKRVFADAMSCAKTPDDWDELDFILSKYPFDVKELEVFCTARGLSIEEEVTTA